MGIRIFNEFQLGIQKFRLPETPQGITAGVLKKMDFLLYHRQQDINLIEIFHRRYKFDPNGI